jgi:hypothetical protein
MRRENFQDRNRGFPILRKPVIDFLLELGFRISWKNSEGIPSQDFVFLGKHFRLDLGLVFPPEEKLLALRQFILTFMVNPNGKARNWKTLLSHTKRRYFLKAAEIGQWK